MLIQFNVKNFMSIKDKIEFSMLAGKDKEHNENLIDIGTSEKYLYSTAMYGANASGKSNFFKALAAAILMVRKSNLRKIDELLTEMVPFKFDEKTINAPCELEFTFIKNGIKYVYGFSADINRVYTEYLYHYLSAKPSLIFERTNVNEYKFNQAERKMLEELASKNTEKKLFLATATEWNYEKTKNAYMWFAENIDVYSNFRNLSDIAFREFEHDDDGKLKEFTLKLLKEADIILKDYDFRVENTISKDLNNEMANITRKIVRVSTLHEVEDENGKKSNYKLDLYEESLGTQILFFISPILRKTFEEGRTMVIDELDKSLHPLLVEFIIKLFHNKIINKNNAQLIFNTHDTNLLSLQLFRRDQIWFTEKNPKNGATYIYPLDDFSVRKTENIQKGYLNGKYGAIPFITSGDVI